MTVPLRCIDLRVQSLIWMQTGITGSIPDISSRMIKEMTVVIAVK